MFIYDEYMVFLTLSQGQAPTNLPYIMNEGDAFQFLLLEASLCADLFNPVTLTAESIVSASITKWFWLPVYVS